VSKRKQTNQNPTNQLVVVHAKILATPSYLGGRRRIMSSRLIIGKVKETLFQK
jgi:hypothetical protein